MLALCLSLGLLIPHNLYPPQLFLSEAVYWSSVLLNIMRPGRRSKTHTHTQTQTNKQKHTHRNTHVNTHTHTSHMRSQCERCTDSPQLAGAVCWQPLTHRGSSVCVCVFCHGANPVRCVVSATVSHAAGCACVSCSHYPNT